MGTIATPRRSRKGGCPICGKPVAPEFRPFCSRRCTHLDLAHWLDGSYAVPGDPVIPEADTPDPDKDEP